MPHEPRQIAFLGREGHCKHYGINAPGAELAAAVRALAQPGAPGFTIAHRGRLAGLGIVYWWAHENELHARHYIAGTEGLEPLDGSGLACVWELEVIDFERRAWLEDVLVGGDVEAYLERALEPVAV
jgi:hypothetical protein